MQSPVLKFTYEDYVLLPESDRRELIEGDFYMVPAPNKKHQDVVANLGFRLRSYAMKNRLGVVMLAPFDVLFSKVDVVQPDLFFVSEERRPVVGEAKVDGAPDMVVEILSPGTAGRDRKLKPDLYARCGVKEYWIVDPEKETVQVPQLGPKGKESLRTYSKGMVPSAVVSGIEMSFADIFVRA